ncbi:MAG: 3-phosphoshikimate 1-carboxyvinyltransferase [Solirubrobacteraceae bacterium]
MTAIAASPRARVRIAPGDPPPRWEVRVPGSKSQTNRALLLAGVAGGVSRLTNPLVADDTEVMADALRALGAPVRTQPGAGGAEWVVSGLGGPPRDDADVWCGMAGTVARFLIPMLAAGRGRFVVDGHDQLRRRPLGPVLAALAAQGTRIDGDALPLTVVADGLAGGEIEVDASVSSQFLSGLVMAAAFAAVPTRLRFAALVSRPYVELTLDVMRAFGVDAAAGEGSVAIVPAEYRAAEVAIEPDASTASYFLASAALTGTSVRLPGVDLDAGRQGDIKLVAHLERMGATVTGRGPLQLTGAGRLHGVHVDMGDSTDVFMTLACVAPFADGPTTIEGIGHARVKESDRVAATAENLRRLGIAVEEGADYLRVHPGTPRSAQLPTYDDHRIAMAFALIGTRVPVVLEDPQVVSKTCPAFFDLWRSTGAVIERDGW